MGMVKQITKYALVDDQGTHDPNEFDRFEGARSEAESRTDSGEPHEVIEKTYVFETSTVAWTPTGLGTWP